MLHAVIVRETLESDLAAVTAIYARAVEAGAASLELQAPDLAETTRRWRMRVGKGYPHIVAERDGAVIGYASARRYRTGPAFDHLLEDSVYVAYDAHGGGVGSVLMTELIARCEDGRFRQMLAVIAGENEPSVRLHERHGFRTVGVMEDFAFKQGRRFDAVLMQRALGKADRNSTGEA